MVFDVDMDIWKTVKCVWVQLLIPNLFKNQRKHDSIMANHEHGYPSFLVILFNNANGSFFTHTFSNQIQPFEMGLT
jgi:hypothetical protein